MTHRSARMPFLPAIVPLALALVTLALATPPALAQQKRVYIGNDEHTDYFWTGDDADYRQWFQQMLDFYMDQADRTASNPPDARGRFNMDGTLWVWEWERNRPPADVERLAGHLRDGTLSLPLNPAVLVYGAMPAEAVLRGMYYAGRLERRWNLRFPLVAAMENQTLPGGLASLWAGSGARYSWRGVCGCASRTDWGDRPREIYHYTGPDGQSVCLKWNTMRTGNTGVGGYAEARDPFGVVDYLTGDPEFLQSWPWAVSAAFGYGWDDAWSTTDAFVNAALSQANASRRVIVSNQQDFFEDFLASYGAQIPAFSGSFGNEWDLYTASMGEATAAFKRKIEALRSAEALASVAALLDPGFTAGREAARDRAFMAAGLYHEHDWTADGPVSRSRRAQFQRDMLADLGGYVDALAADALAVVAAAVAQPAGVERHVVFNPLSWSRTDVADLPSAPTGAFHVVDVGTGQAVPSQLVTVGGQTRVRVLASFVPSVGYRVFEVRPGAGPAFPPAATANGGTADNGLHAVTLGPQGSITSLVDRRDGNRQYVESGQALH
jgi:alpha-mannosidase